MYFAPPWYECLIEKPGANLKSIDDVGMEHWRLVFQMGPCILASTEGLEKTRCLQARCLHNLDSRLLKSAYFPGETGVS